MTAPAHESPATSIPRAGSPTNSHAAFPRTTARLTSKAGSTLAHLAEQCGVDLWQHRSRDGRCLKNALAWLLAYFPKREWPFQQIAPFDWNRLIPLAAASDRNYGTHFLSHANRLPDGSPDYPIAFHPHDGIPVGWQLCPHLAPHPAAS